VVHDLAAQTPIHKTMIVLVGVVRDSLGSSPLLAVGARMATLNVLDGSGERSFVAEGHPDTMRMLRGLFSAEKKKLIELAPGAKPFFFAGMHLSSRLLLPWISAGVECFRAAGFRQADALALASSLSTQAAYAYEKGGRKTWNRKISAQVRQALEQDIGTLKETDPRLADAYAAGLRIALAYFDLPATRAATK
jgi:hypothetical protein